jgi:hypothetical protein
LRSGKQISIAAHSWIEFWMHCLNVKSVRRAKRA